jgi:hypothetical protein
MEENPKKAFAAFALMNSADEFAYRSFEKKSHRDLGNSTKGRLVNARAAITDHREENRERGGEQYRPADTARPGAQHRSQALVNLILVDS